MFLVTVAVGIGAVGAVALAPAWAPRLRLAGSAAAGMTLVVGAIALSACCAAAPPGAMPLRAELSLSVFPLFLLGALLILAHGGRDDDGRRGGGGDEPPWWPEFENAFRQYSRRPRQPVAGR